jgi:hypothetical protein
LVRFVSVAFGVGLVAALLVSGVVVLAAALERRVADFDPGPPNVDWVALSMDPAEDGDGSQLETSYLPCVWYSWPDSGGIGGKSQRVYVSCGWDAIRYSKPHNPHEPRDDVRQP